MRIPSLRPRTAVLAIILASGGFVASGAQAPAPPGVPAVLDPQRVQDQDEMTWADYRPIPGVNWADGSRTPARALRVALVAIDFEDQPFVITRPKHSDPFGNPQVDPVRREAVAKFYADFWGTPGPLNHGHTIHEYWMEQSRGRIGIPKIDVYGPYRMPRRLFEYGLAEYNQQSGCPTGFTCNGRMEPDADRLWAADAGADIASKYEVILRIYAGYDETTVWQEFGEMKFKSRDDIPAEWGNPDSTKPRWVTTRYVPWTSWLAGAQQWGLSSVRQGESSGTITHELGHLVFRIGDNNNNPYVTPYRRVGSGPWDMMDRGSFNGPGGPHRRWVVPAAEGAAMPAGLILRNRLSMQFLPLERVLQLSRDGLAASGLAVTTLTARAVDPAAGAHAGILVRLDGPAPQDRTPPCDRDANPLCAGTPTFNSYSVEVVQRIGYDSFTPDNGVLITKNKDRQDNGCGYGCHAWVIDAKPADMNRLDFTRPDGTRVVRTIADYRQLNDALFHAGLGSGSEYEWTDAGNRLHFYVIDVARDARGILSYTIGVRSLDGAGPQARGVTASAPGTLSVAAGGGRFDVRVTNTGAAGAAPPGTHPGAPPAAFASDIYRVSASTDGAGWTANLQNALVAVNAGGSATVPVFVARTAGSAASARVSVTMVSESDATKKATVTTTVRR
jgi:M6 family metalloprotease-like protein